TSYTGASACVGSWLIGPMRAPPSTPGSTHTGVSAAPAIPPDRPNSPITVAPSTAARFRDVFMSSPPSRVGWSPLVTCQRKSRGGLPVLPLASADENVGGQRRRALSHWRPPAEASRE